MSGALSRAAAAAARRLTGHGASSSSSSSSSSTSSSSLFNIAARQQQRRFAGDLPVKNNPYIERWGTSREHIEDTFHFDRRAFLRAGAWILGFPLAIYFGIVKDFDAADERAGAASDASKRRPPMLGRDDRPDAGPAAASH